MLYRKRWQIISYDFTNIAEGKARNKPTVQYNIRIPEELNEIIELARIHRKKGKQAMGIEALYQYYTNTPTVIPDSMYESAKSVGKLKEAVEKQNDAEEILESLGLDIIEIREIWKWEQLLNDIESFNHLNESDQDIVYDILKKMDMDFKERIESHKRTYEDFKLLNTIYLGKNKQYIIEQIGLPRYKKAMDGYGGMLSKKIEEEPEEELTEEELIKEEVRLSIENDKTGWMPPMNKHLAEIEKRKNSTKVINDDENEKKLGETDIVEKSIATEKEDISKKGFRTKADEDKMYEDYMKEIGKK